MSITEPPQPHSEIAHDLKDIEADLEFERNQVADSIKHDFSTSEQGIVPLDRRRPLWHFMSLFLTFEAGFSYVFIGFTLHDAGYTLAKTAGILALGVLVYLVYAVFAAYLGSRTGQTHTLLTRSILGKWGSWLVSVMVVIAFSGWVGFQANLAAQLWNGLYGWPILGVGIGLAILMITNNLFGFTGISTFARYIVSPLLMLWIAYLVIKGFTTEGSKFLGAHPKVVTPLSGVAAISLVTGFIIWGMEPDFWRYGKPRLSFAIPAFVFALFPGFLLMALGGWIIGGLSSNHAFGPSIQQTTNYSLFGAFWLAWIVVLVTQVALNDGNYYASINAFQNIIGAWRRWRRLYTCLIVACLGGLAAWLVPNVISNGFYKLAAFTAIGVPCATVIMVLDHFLLPRLFGVSRPLTRVPSWRDTASINIPAIVALLVGVGFGAYASGLFSFFGEDPTTNWGLPAPEAWAIAGTLYIVGVAITRAVSNRVTGPLGYARFITEEEAASSAVVDVTNPEGPEQALMAERRVSSAGIT